MVAEAQPPLCEASSSLAPAASVPARGMQPPLMTTENGQQHQQQECRSEPNLSHSETDPDKPRERRTTAYERLSHDLSNDKRCLKEITLGKRIGFYRIRGELGSGNFSQVKLGIHALTKGSC
eukprot:GHVO01012556.1.p1 GENE.GHVO01012556.1~~GHVO01012556.1.p1  ORF type:complete len:122 (-),score=11.49 GHVO01012556.1:257-622(-)